MAAERRTANKPDKDTSSSDSDTDSSSDTDAASDSEASDSEDTALLEGMLFTAYTANITPVILVYIAD
jgi:hypothetical protein